jgi:hypothetical protein
MEEFPLSTQFPETRLAKFKEASCETEPLRKSTNSTTVMEVVYQQQQCRTESIRLKAEECR